MTRSEILTKYSNARQSVRNDLLAERIDEDLAQAMKEELLIEAKDLLEACDANQG